jgi:plasmid stabilization system protein ParE
VWSVELAPAAQADLEALYDHFAKTYLALDYDDPIPRASARIRAITLGALTLGKAPYRGTRHRAGTPFEIRHATLDRAIYWFRLDASRETVIVEGIFHGGQDHLGRMLARLTAEGGAAPPP